MIESSSTDRRAPSPAPGYLSRCNPGSGDGDLGARCSRHGGFAPPPPIACDGGHHARRPATPADHPLALTDPRRVRLCRLIARQAMTTADLADRLAMTRPQVSRPLRALRDPGLVRVERNGRYVPYGLDTAAVERIGRDVVTALQY
ncbi:metalloregulator ArsR/SmtB family transcription factor [Streptomyces sp. NPDC126514]|uniref:ArsR/SmtB family transcription factor n=1 Tax=Streptomyces sp. NPDC126514 TaxID=3155210 RepID=UPI0033271D96